MQLHDAHWVEYGLEALGLGLFMLSASLSAFALEHPAGPLRARLPSASLRRFLMGLAMGATALALIESPIGERSGAHFNPAVTLTFYALGRASGLDAGCYVIAQLAGGWAGMLLARALLRQALGHPSVLHVVTQPGPRGRGPAFLGELAISFLLMSVVLASADRPALAPWTGVLASGLVAAFIFLEAPLSGMSMNPARSLASALSARRFPALWIYFLAPLLGMLLAAEIHTWSTHPVFACAKLNHGGASRCIFCETRNESHP